MGRSSKHSYVVPAALIALCVLAIGLQGCSGDKKDEGPQSRLMKVTFSVPEMCCTSCALKTKLALEKYQGVETAYANFLEKEAWARYDPNMIDVDLLRRAVAALGFKEVIIVSDEPYVPEEIDLPG
jgi:copper chaperone CopZ